MRYGIKEVEKYNLRRREKRLNIRSNVLSEKMDVIADTIFVIKAHIKRHGDEFNKEKKDLLNRRIEKLQIEHANLKESYNILSSGLTYLRKNYTQMIDGDDEENIEVM